MRAKTRSLLLLLVAASAAAIAAGPSKTAAPATRVRAAAPVRPSYAPQIRALRSRTWRLQVLMGRPRAHAPASSARVRLVFWRRTAAAAARQVARPPHRPAWLCIHRYEGQWADGGDPYWGGLQMDRGFMQHYAPRFLLRRGLANRWTPVEQMWVAERALRQGRGFYPWPNSARTCGLL